MKKVIVAVQAFVFPLVAAGVFFMVAAPKAFAAGNLSFIKDIPTYSVRMLLSEMSREPSAEAFGAASGDCAGRAELCAFIDAARRYGLTYAVDFALAGSAIAPEVAAQYGFSVGGLNSVNKWPDGNTIGVEPPKFWSDIELATYRHSYGRGDAAYAVALLDVLDRLPVKHYRRSQLISQLSSLLSSVKAVADPASGMWKSSGGELDATSSAMFVYAILKSVNRRYLSSDWRDYAIELYKKYLSAFVVENSDGTISLRQCHGVGFCPFGHGHTDGLDSAAENGHGAVAAFIRASMEREALENIVYVFDGKCVADGKPATVKVSRELAFNGAEGGGKWTRGGKGGKVITVNTLEDNSDPGSLRYALESEGARIVEFAVSGEIHLKEPLKIVSPCVTISGQTAPGQGITVMDHGLSIEANEVIIRYMRFRMGETAGGSGSALECMGCDNVIIDHCSISWGVNANLTLAAVSNATVSWCIISEALNCQSGECGFGAVLGGRNVSIHHNLFAGNNMGSPRFDHPAMYSGDDILYRRGSVEFVSNVIFNWGEKALWGGEEGWFNVIGNWFKVGTGTKSPDARYVDVAAASDISKLQGAFFIYGNILDCMYVYDHGNYQGKKPEEKRVVILEELYHSLSRKQPFRMTEPMTVQGMEKLLRLVLADVGASKTYDAADKRVIKEVRKEELTYKGSVTGIPGIIDSVNDLRSE